MSDDNKPAAQTGMYIHYCESPGCVAWGGFGFERPNRAIQWFCFEHRDRDYRAKSTAR